MATHKLRALPGPAVRTGTVAAALPSVRQSETEGTLHLTDDDDGEYCTVLVICVLLFTSLILTKPLMVLTDPF